MIKYVCVYSSSSEKLQDIYYKTARELGLLLGENGYNLVYGGGAIGAMYKTAQAVKENGGEVIGVIPEKLHMHCPENPSCDKLIVTKCMRTRKEKMDELSDAFVAIAGGYGTLEELTEMIVQKQLGYSDKAIVILNTNGFYDKLLDFFGVMIKQNFASQNELYYVAKTPQEVVSYLKNYIPKHFDVEVKLGLAQDSKV